MTSEFITTAYPSIRCTRTPRTPCFSQTRRARSPSLTMELPTTMTKGNYASTRRSSPSRRTKKRWTASWGRCDHAPHQTADAVIRQPELWSTRELTPQERIDAAVALALRFGGIPGDHHRAWVLDQVLRALTGPAYVRHVQEYERTDCDPDAYSWDVGIPP